MASTKFKAAVCDGLAKYIGSNNLADFSIVCGASTWKVHRLVLSLHSSVLAKACDGDFKETHERKVDLSEHDKDHVEALVQYMYRATYEVVEEMEHAKKLCFHVKVSLVADKYDIEGLKALAEEKCNAPLKTTTDQANVAVVATVAYKNSIATHCIREAIVSHVVDSNIILDGQKTCEELEAAMTTYPEFAIQVMKAMRKYALAKEAREKARARNQYKCPSCNVVFEGLILDMNYKEYFCISCGIAKTGQYWQRQKNPLA